MGAVEGLQDAIAIAVGEDHCCALRSSGAVVCWGSNTQGALGDGTDRMRLVPGPVVGLGPALALAVGEQHSCALGSAPAQVQCWGRDLRELDVPRGWDVVRTPAAIVGLPGSSAGR